MPCDTVTTQTVNAGLVKAHPDVIKEAMRALGGIPALQKDGSLWASTSMGIIRWDARQGIQLTAGDTETLKGRVIAAYSKAAVSWAAQRAGWKVGAWEGQKVTMTRGG